MRINDRINAQEVRLISSTGDQVGVVSKEKALELAKNEDLDLVEIVANQSPPVCRIMDYGKYKFEQEKFRPGTEEADYQVKLKNLIKFLQGGDKAKITMRFRGREAAHQIIGREFLERVEKDLFDYGAIEQKPAFEGRQIVMVIAPKK